MSELTRRIGRATKRAIEDAETRVLANEGRKSLKSKVARVKRVTKKALKAGAIAGAVVATAVVMRERKRRRKLES